MSAPINAATPVVQTQYSNSTAKAGDLISAATVGTTDTAYASSLIVPANTMAVGQVWRMRGAGRFTASALTPPSQRARIWVGSTAVIDTGAQALLIGASNARFWFDITMIVRAIGASGSLECYGKLDFATGLTGTLTGIFGPSGTASETTNPVAIDTTVSQKLAASVQFSANTAGNSSELRQLVIDMAPPSSASN